MKRKFIAVPGKGIVASTNDFRTGRKSVKRRIHAATDEDNWDDLKVELADDCEFTGDPFYEMTEAAETITWDYQKPVEEELGIWLEPSVQAGSGGIWIYSSEDDSTLAEDIDYQEFNDYCLDLVMEADSGEEFKQLYKKYLKSLIA